MNTSSRLANASIRMITDVMCHVDASQLEKIPNSGPLILYSNHINFLEIPLIASRLNQREFSILAKTETWHNPIIGKLFDLWNGIPIRRGEADFDAYNKALDILKDGKILAMAPEGTRSGTGSLQRGLPGIVLLAIRSGAPLLPVAHYGGEVVWDNLKKFKKTHFQIRVGYPFKIKTDTSILDRIIRQQITDEVMFQLAALLPPSHRGRYSDINSASVRFLEFTPGIISNIIPDI